MAIQGHTAVTISLNSTTVPAVDQWFGYSLHELASTDAGLVIFRDGVSTGQILYTISQTSAGWDDNELWTRPITVPSGVLHIDTTGAPVGVVYV